MSVAKGEMQFGPLTRRELIALSGAAVAFPRAARTQQAGERRVGVLMGMVENDPEARLRIAAFWQGYARSDGRQGATSISSFAGSPGFEIMDDLLIRTMRESPRYAEQPSLGNLFAVLLGPSSPVEPNANVYALDQRAG
jgi:hypothetical protein